MRSSSARATADVVIGACASKRSSAQQWPTAILRKRKAIIYSVEGSMKIDQWMRFGSTRGKVKSLIDFLLCRVSKMEIKNWRKDSSESRALTDHNKPGHTTRARVRRLFIYRDGRSLFCTEKQVLIEARHYSIASQTSGAWSWIETRLAFYYFFLKENSIQENYQKNWGRPRKSRSNSKAHVSGYLSKMNTRWTLFIFQVLLYSDVAMKVLLIGTKK